MKVDWCHEYKSEHQDISIDLVVDQARLDRVESITPVDRVDVSSVKVCDYLVYLVENGPSSLMALAEAEGIELSVEKLEGVAGGLPMPDLRKQPDPHNHYAAKPQKQTTVG